MILLAIINFIVLSVLYDSSNIKVLMDGRQAVATNLLSQTYIYVLRVVRYSKVPLLILILILKNEREKQGHRELKEVGLGFQVSLIGVV